MTLEKVMTVKLKPKQDTVNAGLWPIGSAAQTEVQKLADAFNNAGYNCHANIIDSSVAAGGVSTPEQEPELLGMIFFGASSTLSSGEAEKIISMSNLQEIESINLVLEKNVFNQGAYKP